MKLTPKEQRHVRTALRFLRLRASDWKIDAALKLIDKAFTIESASVGVVA